MVRRHIPIETKEIAIRMVYEGVSYSKIRKDTGMSERAISRLVNTYRTTGGLVRIPACAGRPRALNGFEVEVSGIPTLGILMYITCLLFST